MAKTTVSEARNNLPELVNRASYRQERIVIERRGKPVAALVSLEDFNRLEALEDTGSSTLVKVKQEEDELMLSQFLDFLMEKALRNPEELERYTQEMSDEDDELMAGVVIDL